MGATNCPETPRQKMITMMYLVYTAMLALNVSAEVIQGFKSVGTALHESNKNLGYKLIDSYDNFRIADSLNNGKYDSLYTIALEVRELSNGIKNYIDSIECDFIGSKVASSVDYTDPRTGKEWKLQLRDENGNATIENVRTALDSIGFSWFTDKQLEDNHGPAQYFIGPDVKNPDPNLAAIKIKNKVIEFKQRVNEVLGVDSIKVETALKELNMSDGYNKEGELVPWEVNTFNEVITGAALVTLTRLKTEMMNAEYAVVEELFKQVSKGDKKFSNIAMISRPRSTYILQGGTYETRINVAAYDSKQKFTATVNGQHLTSGDSGTVIYKATCNTLGPQRITGTAYVTGDNGVEEYPINDFYFVAKPAGVVRLDGLQVMYAGLENPVTISAAGVDGRSLSLAIEPAGQADITKSEGEGSFIVKPRPGAKKLTLSVNATIDKRTSTMGTQTVIVKDIPAPIIKVAGVESGGRLDKKELSASTVVIPIKNPDFLLKIDNRSIRIIKMLVSVGAKEETVNGPRFNESIASMIRKATKGEKLVIQADVMMPDGKPKSVTYTATLR